MNILGSLKQKEQPNSSNARRALTNATVTELSDLVAACVEDVGVLARHAVDRTDINKCVVTLVSSETYVMKADKMLESMESKLILTSKQLDEAHKSAMLVGKLRQQLSSTLKLVLNDSDKADDTGEIVDKGRIGS